MNPEYPVYIVSKGRWESRLTSRALDRMRVGYHIVVEPCEYSQYAAVINPHKILTLPFSNLGQGSIPARNWIWDHAISQGAYRHWILDDNIEAFNRLNRNIKPVVETGAIFKAAEDFVDRYENIALAGFNYYSFCKQTEKLPPYYLNTRIYSCILIRNDIPYRWRGRYNEDTDLSLRVLKDGWCTLLFNAFLAGKVCTMRMKGGNTDELYKEDGRKKMAEALVEMHPDVAKVVWKFKRWHHQVDYRPFKKNRLIRNPLAIVSSGVNNYGMVLEGDTGSQGTQRQSTELREVKMNFKLVLKTYSQLRQLSDDEAALLATLRAMSDSERELLVESLGPPVKVKSKPVTKKFSKCDVCGISKRAAHHRDTNHEDYHEFQSSSSKSKSARASSLAEKITGTAGARPSNVEVFDIDDLCKCGHMVDNNVHHKTTDPEYHPFESSQSEAAATGD